MASLLSRWASLGVGVSGEINPVEDPEVLLAESLEKVGDEDRLLGVVATWLSRYGHLLLTKKLRFRSERARRIFSALIDRAGVQEPKLRRMVQPPAKGEPDFLFSDMTPTEKEWAQKAPDPHFLKQGFILKKHDLIRPKILHQPEVVFAHSAILRNRAHYGSTLRADLLAVFPNAGPVSLSELSRRLHVAPAGVHHVIRDLIRSGLAEWVGVGRRAKLRWVGLAAA